MADDVLELADKLWRGDIDIVEIHPVGGYLGGLAEVADGVGFVPSFANVSAVATGDGLVLVDTGSSFVAKAVHETVRRWSALRLQHRHLLPRPHRPRLRGGRLGGGVVGAGLARSGGGRPRRRAGALRPLHRHRRLQRDHQPAAVRRPRAALAHRVPLPRPHLRATPRARRRWCGLRPPPRPGRDRRPHLDVDTRCPRAVLRRPLHLGVAERREPPEGAALPPRVGRRPAGDGRPGARGPAAGPRLPRRRRRARSARRSPTPPSSSTPSSTRPSTS